MSAVPYFFFFSSRRRHTRCSRDWSSDVCSSDLVGIARAIAGQPKYLLYDEPTSGLDPVNADVIDGLIERLRDELGVTSVVVSHDVRGSFRVADRVALLWQAKIRAVGPPDAVLASKDPAVLQI